MKIKKQKKLLLKKLLLKSSPKRKVRVLRLRNISKLLEEEKLQWLRLGCMKKGKGEIIINDKSALDYFKKRKQ